MDVGLFTMPLHPPGANLTETLKEDSPSDRRARQARLLRGLDRRALHGGVGEHSVPRAAHRAGDPAHDADPARDRGELHAEPQPLRPREPHRPARPHGGGPVQLGSRHGKLPRRHGGVRLLGRGCPHRQPRLHADGARRGPGAVDGSEARPARGRGVQLHGPRTPGRRRPSRPCPTLSAAASPNRGRGRVTGVADTQDGGRPRLDSDVDQPRSVDPAQRPTGSPSRKAPAVRGLEPDIGAWRVAREVLVAETGAEARKLAREGIMARDYNGYFFQLLPKVGMMGLFKNDPDMPDSDVTMDYLIDNVFIVGSVDEVAQQLNESAGRARRIRHPARDGPRVGALRRVVRVDDPPQERGAPQGLVARRGRRSPTARRPGASTGSDALGVDPRYCAATFVFSLSWEAGAG